MAGIGSVLSIARTAMSVHQTALQTASSNIANVETAGYSRQRVNLAGSPSQLLPTYSVGLGVTITGIERNRDVLLDATYRTNEGLASASTTTRDLVQQIEGILGEPSDKGLAASFDAFWSSWSELAQDPTSVAARSVVLQKGSALADNLNAFDNQLNDLDQRAREDLFDQVAQVNHLAQQIAEINPRITASESGRSPANDMRDDRDRALDSIAKLIGGQIINRTDGTVGIYVGGRLIIDANEARPLDVLDTNPPAIVLRGTLTPISGVAGSLGATIGVLSTDIPNVKAKLDSLAKGLIDTVNAIHSTGTLWTGTPPVSSPAGNFFEVTAVPPATGDPLKTAGRIKLASTLSNPSAIAASGAAATGPGNNSVALALAALHDTVATFTSPDGSVTLGTGTIGDFYNSIVSSTATTVHAADDAATIHETLASNADTRRQAIMGVSTDEELMDVIAHQHAYSAAARLVTVVDEMMQTLVDLGR